MLQLRCLPIIEGDDIAAERQEFRLDLAGDPARLLLTLNLCRLAMPADTHPLHIENWRQLEMLVRHLSIVYRQVGPRNRMRCKRDHGRQ